MQTTLPFEPGASPDRLSLVAGWAAYASGVIGAVSVLFFALFVGAYVFTGRAAPWPIGRINDLTSMLMYLVALPIPLALHRRLRAAAPARSLVALWLGVAGMAGVAALQYLLVTGALTFAQQGGPVTAAILLVGAWLLITAYLGRASGRLPGGVRLSWLAVPYFGSPLWAFWVGRRLLAGSALQPAATQA